jgi:malonyl CoA-acyl carrier protein transacylase
VIANYNAPTQMVLSGSTNEIQRARRDLPAAQGARDRSAGRRGIPQPFRGGAAVPFRAAVAK